MPRLPKLTPETLQFVLLSFEGPDQYSMAGGLGVRMKELGLELARQGFNTHHIFIGDPSKPARSHPHKNLTLHRWCRWLSERHPSGVYDGEESKLLDWNNSVPPFVTSELVRPAAQEGKLTAVLAEEWHTAFCTCQLSDQLWRAGLRDQAIILWNANNIMGFDRIDWGRLNYCSQITAVSRYMKHLMWTRGVNPLVIPNGIPADRIRKLPEQSIKALRAAIGVDEVLFKIGRWSPDKRWNMAIEALAAERLRGRSISMVIRGGIEPHALEVLHNAHTRGLKIVDLRLPEKTSEAIAAFNQAPRADIYNVLSFMTDDIISLFYAAADAVLANSGHEPFGLVGLEVMAAGGMAFVGSTGEDYAIPWLNGVVLDSDDPAEICVALQHLREQPQARVQMRREAKATAENYTWKKIVEDALLQKLKYTAVRQDVRVASWPLLGSIAYEHGTMPAGKTPGTAC
ncbi:MAG: D-inositol-3-phosphate glycosyltransferase [Actinobacteria bacterium ADurb.Bin444]|nr:MAG: D-inositol-3-phosphate glycosyltransferase [Actinobacteria bacterium ADurb.Bin444]